MFFFMFGAEYNTFFSICANSMLALGFVAGIPGIVKLARGIGEKGRS